MNNSFYVTTSIKGKTLPVWVGEDGCFNLQIIQNTNRGISVADTVVNANICEHLQDDPVIASFGKDAIFDVTGFATKFIQMPRNTSRTPRWSITRSGSGTNTYDLDEFFVIVSDDDADFTLSPKEQCRKQRVQSN